jgi:hypothetical protein
MIYENNVDTRVLLTRLIAYRKSLESHLNQLGSECVQLENRWRMFNSVAEGNYADQFRAGWLKTDAQFNEYNAQSVKIKSFLDERIDFLTRLNGENLEIRYASSFSAVSSSKVEPKIKAKSVNLKRNLGNPTDNKIPGTDINYPDGKYQAHHVIPGECADKSPLVRTALELGFDIDSAINGIYLPQEEETQSRIMDKSNIELPLHSGYHKRYSDMIDNILDNSWQDVNGNNYLSNSFVNQNDTLPQKVFTTLKNAIDTIKEHMVEGVLDTEDMYKGKPSNK